MTCFHRLTQRTMPILATAVVFLAQGCMRGSTSELPPVHLNPNMDFQQKFDPQEKTSFFKDGRAMRAPVEGTVVHGALREGVHMTQGRNEDTGRLVDALPTDIEFNQSFLKRGRERYNIYCAPCHDQTGHGQGIVTQRGGGLPVAPPTFHSERMAAMPLGYFFHVISNGVGEPPNQNMLSYAAQIPVEDRWAIAAWVRTLQVYPRWENEGKAGSK